jgi:hypothetical protein
MAALPGKPAVQKDNVETLDQVTRFGFGLLFCSCLLRKGSERQIGVSGLQWK